VSARRLAIAAVALLATLAPAAAWACAVCGTGDDRNRTAFFWMTIFLSLTPLAAMGAGVWWIVRHARARGFADEFTEREAPGPSAVAPPGSAAPPVS
jgi:hypothetical protein